MFEEEYNGEVTVEEDDEVMNESFGDCIWMKTKTPKDTFEEIYEKCFEEVK